MGKRETGNGRRKHSPFTLHLSPFTLHLSPFTLHPSKTKSEAVKKTTSL